MATLIWIEHDGQDYHPSTLQLVKACEGTSKPLVALVLGNEVAEVANKIAHIQGIDEVRTSQAQYYYPFRAEPIAKMIAEQSRGMDAIFALSTTTGKNILPRVAAMLDQNMLTDVIQNLGNGTFLHPIYAGNALAEEQFVDSRIIATIRATAFDKAELSSSPCVIHEVVPQADDARTKIIQQAKRDNSKMDLQSAKVVVSGGRGFGTAENFKLAEAFAQSIGAALGATRAAVDAGFATNEIQVGQTGKIVAPEVYIAIGISGAIQHMAGMKDSKNIVAINKDPDAPIFDVATYGLVADLFEVLPKLMKELSSSF